MNQKIERAMNRVITSLYELEELWYEDAPEPHRTAGGVYGRMLANRVGEARMAHDFGLHVKAIVGRMFTFNALAKRYGIANRTMQDCVYFTARSHIER